jgi:hypothetical protein
MKNIKIIPMKEYRKLDIYEAIQITTDLLEKVKDNDIFLSDINGVRQWLNYNKDKDTYELVENANLDDKDYRHNGMTYVYIKENDILIKTDLGYKKNLLSVKIIDDKQEKLITKFNKLG